MLGAVHGMAHAVRPELGVLLDHHLEAGQTRALGYDREGEGVQLLPPLEQPLASCAPLLYLWMDGIAARELGALQCVRRA